MTSLHLEKLLSGHVFTFMVLFSRVSAVLMLFPGIGESFVPARIRMMFALSLCLLLLEPMQGHFPTPPSSMPDFVRLIGYEVLIGLFFGTFLRFLMSGLESAGTIIGLQTGLSNATIMNPAMAAQSPLPSAFLSVAGLALIFITGLDHFLLRSILDTYNVFPVGGELMPGDMAQQVMRTTNDSFKLGIELAAPFLVIGLLGNLAVGLIQKLLPQVQLFMIMMPVQIWGGLILLAVTMTSILTLWLQYVDDSVVSFLSP